MVRLCATLSMTTAFDLNIEKILEDWDVHQAVRELIANAIDEQLLTNTAEVEIRKNPDGAWIIRDFGRGLRPEHLTQKENEEKLSDPRCIGKFGIGLKDALATLDRRGVGVRIQSRFGDFTVGLTSKAGFPDIKTLHGMVGTPRDPGFRGTEIRLDGARDESIELAKALFLRYSGDVIIENTKYGAVVRSESGHARIYFNGVRINEEEGFLFSYNITSPTKALQKALNRERTNVGRQAYADRVKAILLTASSVDVATPLVGDLRKIETGSGHDELKWIDVQEHAVKILSAQSKSVFLTSRQLQERPEMVDEARRGGFSIVTIPENLSERIRGAIDHAGNSIRDLSQFELEYNASFEFDFVDPKDLNTEERQVWGATDRILELVGGRPRQVTAILISETMRAGSGGFQDANGVWEDGKIIVKRSQLRHLGSYAGTLLHEVAHARSASPDCDRGFELELTSLLGSVAAEAIGPSREKSASASRPYSSKGVATRWKRASIRKRRRA